MVEVLYRLYNVENPNLLRTSNKYEREGEMFVPNERTVGQLKEMSKRTKELSNGTIYWSENFEESYFLTTKKSDVNPRRIANPNIIAVFGDTVYLKNERVLKLENVEITCRYRPLGEVDRVLMKHLPKMKLRRFLRLKCAPKYAVMNGQPAVQVGTIAKTGKFLRRNLPTMSDKDIQNLARALDECNPAFERQRMLRTVKLGPLSSADNAPEGAGSCMYRKGFWQQLEKLLHPAPTTLPDGNVPWEDGTGPLALIWEELPKEVAQGCKCLRAFLWPIELPNGQRKWFLDRVYPSSNYGRDFVNEFCEMFGYLSNGMFYKTTGDGVYRERAQEQPPMKHYLAKSIHGKDNMPWMDCLCAVSVDGMSICTPRHPEGSNQWIQSTGGVYVSKNESKCSCGKAAKYYNGGEYSCEEHLPETVKKEAESWSC